MRTTLEMEDFIPSTLKMLQSKQSPKWMALRIFINFSLGIKDRDYQPEVPDFNSGKEYRLLQVTGLGKETDDQTSLYTQLVSIYDGVSINTNKELEARLEYHAFRGFIALKYSLSSKSNIFEFLGKEVQ